MTETKPSSKEILYYGEAKPLPEPVLLKAGPLRMLYENGAIRYIRYGDMEVLRRVYAALRDHNWDTVEPVIRQEKIEKDDNSFRIELEVEYRQGDVHFMAHYLYTGTETGVVRFEMKGTCISSFKKNRIGFCVLHPIRECAGNECLITDPGGKTTSQRFPSAISPHQPFMTIETMQWELPDAVTATLKFGGEVFETEDQRNWTDASFKTYSTPLALPFPVQMQAGEEINQVVELSVRGNREAAPNVSPDHKPLYFEISDRSADLPLIGLGRSTEVPRLTSEAIALLRKTGFHHYRVDVDFRKNWQDSLQLACEEAEALGLPLELALHFTGESYEREVEEVVSLLSGAGATVFAFLLLQENKKTTPPELIEVLVPVLRRYFPAAKIGGGTNAYFAELNRQTPPAEKLDFLSYSINPQVHAFDTLSLVETLETQGGTVGSAQKLAGGKDIHISPVTLKPRFNPNATTANDEEQNPDDTVDVRQMSLIGAGWTLGSVKYLAEAGAKSITYYETAGKKGILMGEAQTITDSFPALPGQVFPLFAVFQTILKDSSARVLCGQSSNSLVFDGLVLKTTQELCVVLANYTGQNQEVVLPLPPGQRRVYLLDGYTLQSADWWARWDNQSGLDLTADGTVILPPYGLVKVTITRS